MFIIIKKKFFRYTRQQNTTCTLIDIIIHIWHQKKTYLKNKERANLCKAKIKTYIFM